MNKKKTEDKQFNIKRIYVKSSSFDITDAPLVFESEEELKPEVQMEMRQKVDRVSETKYELTLHTRLTAKQEERTIYLLNLQQAGVFEITGLDEKETQAVLSTYAPNTLYCYARKTIADMTINGGLPPLTLDPVSFDSLYAHQQQTEAAQKEKELETIN